MFKTKLIKCLLFIFKARTVPKSPRIDFDKVKPAFMAVEKPDLSKLTPEQWKKIIEEDLKPMTTERFPGYKKGNINLSGNELIFRSGVVIS